MKAYLFFHGDNLTGTRKWILLDEDGYTRADFLPDCPWVNWLFGCPKKGVMNVVDLRQSKVVGTEPLQAKIGGAK